MKAAFSRAAFALPLGLGLETEELLINRHQPLFRTITMPPLCSFKRDGT